MSIGLLAVLLLVLFAGTASAQDPQDCADFSTQEEAQAFYNDHRDDDPNDPDPFDLDTDGDGLACEGLPTAQGTQASPTATPSGDALPQNGAEAGVIALSGLSLLEAGYGLTLASKRLGIRRRSVPLYLMRRMINAAERGRDRIEIADDFYLVHASVLERNGDGHITQDLDQLEPDVDLDFDADFVEIELSESDPADLEVPPAAPPSLYAALARPNALPTRDR